MLCAPGPRDGCRRILGDMDGSQMSNLTDINSQRLRLVALDAALAEAQLSDRAGFFRQLGVEPEPAWPPELMDEATMGWVRDALAVHPGDTGWYTWVYISPVMNRLLGTGGFRGAPDENGCVEIGYSMLTSYREQGLATEGVLALLGWQFDEDAGRDVIEWTHDRSRMAA